MRTFSEFQIIGRVGKVKEVGPTLRIRIAAEYGRRDEDGEFRSNPYWNEVTLFREATITWAKAHVGPGDLVHARGTLRQTEYEKDGAKVYGVTLAAEDFDLLSKRPADQVVEG
jgi:single-stranded DNA-binding protein